MFEDLVATIRDVLPGFGKSLAIDSKAIKSHAKKQQKGKKGRTRDGRRDIDADTGVKKYKGKRKDGTLWEKVSSLFGYKLHLIVDSIHELPVAYTVTKASRSDITEAHKILNNLERHQEEILEDCEEWSGDRGYDDGELIQRLWDDHEIKHMEKSLCSIPDTARNNGS